MATLKAVIFDYSTVLVDVSKTTLLAEIGETMIRLANRQVQLVVFSTHDLPIGAELDRRGLPQVDQFIHGDFVGAPKGSPTWIRKVEEMLGLATHELLYVGDDRLDWRTAINAGVLFLHARWAKPLQSGPTVIVVDRPHEVYDFASHFLLIPPRWQFSLDDNARGVHVRCLLGFSTRLPARSQTSFTLQDVFTHDTNVMVSTDNSARDLLGTHALTSLYLEGEIPVGTLFVIYPSSTPGKRSAQLQGYFETAVKLFHGYFHEDLLIRARQTIDTSLERHRARVERRAANVSFETQTGSVYVAPGHRELIQGRTVVVWDDFTSTGMSLEWARNALSAAGAGKVILATMGKYPGGHRIYRPTRRNLITPYELTEYPESSFAYDVAAMTQQLNAPRVIHRSFERFGADLAYDREA